MADAAVTVTPTDATPQGNDVLAITGTVQVVFGTTTYAAQVTAQGWTSAVHNHLGPEAFGPDGQRLGHWENTDGKNLGADRTQLPDGGVWVNDVAPREMTSDEVAAYCTDLLLQAFVAATPLVPVAGQNLLAPPGA